MRLMETFAARGHPNIKAGHRTTLMVTREPELTPRGDCIVAVAAERGLGDLGRGNAGLTLSNPTDMIARRSRYMCDRTLMVGANKAACDIEPPLLRLLQNPDQVVNVTLVVET